MFRTATGWAIPSGGEAVRTERVDLDRCAYAAARLKAIGFEHVTTSMRSEAAYYALPGRRGLLRVAAHGTKKMRHFCRPVVAKITLSSNVQHKTPAALDQHIALYVGRYLMAHADGDPA